jgi:hypothetical protein
VGTIPLRSYKTCQDVLAGYGVLYQEKSLDHSNQFDKTSPINFPDVCSLVVAAENGVNSLTGCWGLTPPGREEDHRGKELEITSLFRKRLGSAVAKCEIIVSGTTFADRSRGHCSHSSAMPKL